MSKKTPGTLDLFSAIQHADPLPGQWPDPRRFPLNQDGSHVEDLVLRDLKTSRSPLIITGFSALDRLIDFVADAQQCDKIRLVFGSEPFDSRREEFSLDDCDLPQEIQDYWLDRCISILLSAKLLLCIERLKAGTVQARYVARSPWRMHAKIYVGDEAATLGSSNFTEPGLKKQLEANVRFQKAARSNEEQTRYEETVQIAEEFWKLGTDYNQQLIALLEQLLRLVPWEEALARAATELLDGDWAKRFLRGGYLPGDADLWPSQRQGIAQALYILNERGSVLVADATGSGKTRAGIHLIGAKIHEIIASNRLRQGKALLICPPSVVPNWQAESAQASVQVDIFSHGALSQSRSSGHDNILNNLRRAQLLCVDEGHNFLNTGSNRTQHLLRNMADHVMLFTATPINRSAQDLLRIADMLGADNLEESTIKAFEKMLGVRSLSRTLEEDEIALLRKEIAKFTLRRTKRMLNDLIKKDPDAYRDAKGRPCRFPKHEAKIYSLNEPKQDRNAAIKIQALADGLKGVIFFRKEIALPALFRQRNISEQQFLDGRLKGASKLSKYLVMRSLRSSKAALLEHIAGTDEAVKRYGLTEFSRNTASGNMLLRLEKISGKIPKNCLNIKLPAWLSDKQAHRQACLEDAAIYQRIREILATVSDTREQGKAAHVLRQANKFTHVLAFDSRPITLAVIRKRLLELDQGLHILVATGDTGSDKDSLLGLFNPASDNPGNAIGLCSDSVAEGVNLQRAQVVVHLDMPSVVRIAEQRVGRVDRLDSPYKTIHAWWPEDAEEFALHSDERFIERYETVDNLLGSNMPLPLEVAQKSRSGIFTAHDAITDFEANAGSWDGIDDAFSPVRKLVDGDDPLVPAKVYASYAAVKARVISRVSLVAAKKPWAFFCTMDSSGVPKWILLKDSNSPPQTDLLGICITLRSYLRPEVENLKTISPATERILDMFIKKLMFAERQLLSQRKQRALEEMEKVLDKFILSAGARRDQRTVTVLEGLLGLLRDPDPNHQPNWEEVAARWLDLIRPIWYERLQYTGRKKPLLLKDIRRTLVAAEESLLPKIIAEFSKTFPLQKRPDERIIACIIGVG